MRGDALASGASSATFTSTENKKLTDKQFAERVDVPEPVATVFCGCNAKGCEEFVFYSAAEFSDHVHDIHPLNDVRPLDDSVHF